VTAKARGLEPPHPGGAAVELRALRVGGSLVGALSVGRLKAANHGLRRLELLAPTAGKLAGRALSVGKLAGRSPMVGRLAGRALRVRLGLRALTWGSSQFAHRWWGRLGGRALTVGRLKAAHHG
jgi:hypothetical protein